MSQCSWSRFYAARCPQRLETGAKTPEGECQITKECLECRQTLNLDSGTERHQQLVLAAGFDLPPFNQLTHSPSSCLEIGDNTRKNQIVKKRRRGRGRRRGRRRRGGRGRGRRRRRRRRRMDKQRHHFHKTDASNLFWIVLCVCPARTCYQRMSRAKVGACSLTVLR